MTAFAQNVGKPLSLNHMLEILGDAGYSHSNKNYFHLCAALFRRIPRFDIRKEEFLPGADKFYCIDNGILHTLAAVDEDTLAENAICIELLRRGYSVYSGKLGKMSVTFMAVRGREKVFVQVLATSGLSVRRSTRPLRELTAESKKFLIISKPEKIFDGVTNITLRDFLSNV